MLTLRYLLALVGAVLATTVVGIAVLASIQYADLYAVNVAESIAVGKPAKAPNPILITVYRVNYTRGDAAHPFVLTDRPGIYPPFYALGVGNGCPTQLPPAVYEKAYGPNNNTIHITGCTLVLPWVDVRSGVKIVHYIPLCTSGTDFSGEVVEEDYGVFTVSAFVIWC